MHEPVETFENMGQFSSRNGSIFRPLLVIAFFYFFLHYCSLFPALQLTLILYQKKKQVPKQCDEGSQLSNTIPRTPAGSECVPLPQCTKQAR